MAAITDGTFTTAKQDGPRVPGYPFLMSFPQDVTACTYDRTMVIYPVSSYVLGGGTRTSVTNLLTYSEAFDNAAWTKADATVTANSVANPMDATVSADSLLEAATSAEHVASQAGTIAASAVTFTVCVKALGRDHCRLKITDSAATTKTAFFNLATGVVGTVSSGATSSIYQVASGWYCCSLTFTSPAAGTATCYVQPSTDGSTVSYAGDTAKGLYVFGAQLVQASSVSAYAATTSATRTISAPNIEVNETLDGTDPFAYLAYEGNLQVSAGAGYFLRRYARIPGTQTQYGSRLFDRPVMHDILSGTSYAASFDNGRTSHVFTSRKTVSSVGALSGGSSVAVAPQSFGSLPSANFTMVDSGANSSTKNFTTAVATLQSELATALASLSSLSVSAVPGGITIAWTGTVKSFTTADTSVTIVGGAGLDGSVTIISNAPTVTDTQAHAYGIRTISATTHGGLAGDKVVLWNADRIIGLTTVISKNTNDFVIACSTDELTSSTLAITHCGFAPDAAARYLNGPVSVSTKETMTFSLPGVTTGITTPADIALLTPAVDPVSWLGQIVAYIAGGSLSSYYVTIQGSQLEPWGGTPIFMQTSVACQMSDALRTVSVSA